MNVVPLPVVRAQKSLHMKPRAVYGICMGACTLFIETNVMVNCAVRVTCRVEIPVRSSALTDNRGDRFDSCIYNGLQSISGSVRNGNEKRFTGLTLNTAKHPLLLNMMALWYFRRPNLLSSILTFLLGPPIFSEQPSMYSSIVCLLYKPHSAIVLGEKRCSLCIIWAGTRRKMSCVRYITSCKVSLLCWNHEGCLVHFVSEHKTAALLRHGHLKHSFGLRSANQVISRPLVLHGTLVRNNPTSSRNWMLRSVPLKRNVRKSLFASPSSPSEARP